MLKKTGKIILIIFLLLLSAELLLYFTCPVYDFPPPMPFSGRRIHNPYEGMDSTSWRKANFHYHAKAWGGITSGSENSYEAYYENYRVKLNYDFPAISDYQKINDHFKDSSFYIPAYEHGFGIRKKHQMLIGAKEVLWMDYSLFQNIHQKQHILQLLQGKSEIIAVAHPDWENGYTPGDLRMLTGYHLMEILDHNWRSYFQWDAALSAGRPVYILADDDSHDINDVFEIGRCMTFINSPLNADSAVIALKNGKAFGADVEMQDVMNDFDKKAEAAKKIPLLNAVEMHGDTLKIRVSETALKIAFIGQNMQLKKAVYGTASAEYILKPGDTYIRTEIVFYNKWKGPGTKFYLNPVFRYTDIVPDNSLKAEVNFARTWIFRLLSVPAVIVIGIFIFQMIFRKNKSE